MYVQYFSDIMYIKCIPPFLVLVLGYSVRDFIYLFPCCCCSAPVFSGFGLRRLGALLDFIVIVIALNNHKASHTLLLHCIFLLYFSRQKNSPHISALLLPRHINIMPCFHCRFLGCPSVQKKIQKLLMTS